MVRTANSGIRISAGKSSKKTGGGTSSSTPSSSGTGSKSKSGSGSSKLPPIPFQETPAWQKPITNFFKLESSPLKSQEENFIVKTNDLKEDINKKDLKEAGPSKKKLKMNVDKENEKDKCNKIEIADKETVSYESNGGQGEDMEHSGNSKNRNSNAKSVDENTSEFHGNEVRNSRSQSCESNSDKEDLEYYRCSEEGISNTKLIKTN